MLPSRMVNIPGIVNEVARLERVVLSICSTLPLKPSSMPSLQERGTSLAASSHSFR
jgi:hypothetical protein